MVKRKRDGDNPCKRAGVAGVRLDVDPRVLAEEVGSVPVLAEEVGSAPVLAEEVGSVLQARSA